MQDAAVRCSQSKIKIGHENLMYVLSPNFNLRLAELGWARLQGTLKHVNRGWPGSAGKGIWGYLGLSRAIWQLLAAPDALQACATDRWGCGRVGLGLGLAVA